ncbi:MAG: ArsR family transcriptional regulator, partial [Pseudomonadota bacterium]
KKKNACVCGSLVEDLPLAQATISQHLKVLKGAGLVKGTISGVNTCYCIDERALKKLNGFVEKLL